MPRKYIALFFIDEENGSSVLGASGRRVVVGDGLRLAVSLVAQAIGGNAFAHYVVIHGLGTLFGEFEVGVIVAHVVGVSLYLHLHRGVFLEKLDEEGEHDLGVGGELVGVGLVVDVAQVAHLAGLDGLDLGVLGDDGLGELLGGDDL